LALLALVGPLAAVVRAVDPPRLAGPVTDQTGALAGGASRIEAALDDLLTGENVQLFVLFVDSTDALSVTDFADETARRNSLGVNDALLVVALDDRTDAIWISDGLEGVISDPELDAVISGTLEPRLGDGDFVDAVVETAAGLGKAASAVTPTTGPGPTERPSEGGAGVGDIGGFIGIVLLGLGIVILLVWLAGRISRVLASRREAEERDRRTGRLAREANSLLVATDERLRTASDAADFVEAEFGEEQAVPFRSAISQARDEMKAAFAIRQRLDDAEPEDPPTREKMLTEIVERGKRANAALDAQAARIAELRDIEKNAGAVLAALPAQLDAQDARLADAAATLDRLRQYAPGAWKSVEGNVIEARKGLEGARAAIARASATPPPGGPGLVREILLAQEGIAGARGLIDGVDAQAGSIHDAEHALDEELTAADKDLSTARSVLREGQAAPADAPDMPDLDAAARSLAAARTAAAASPRDPIAAHRDAVRARASAAAALTAARGAATERARVHAALDAALRSAAIDIRRASDFIATRRNGVGRRARTRLAEAQRMLEQARDARDRDPSAALTSAGRAERLAEEAYSLATADFGRWDAGGPSPTGGGGGGGSDLAGAILGGIIGGILSGGGRGGGRGGGWGGSNWGSPGPRGGGGFGGGGGGGGGGWGGGGHSMGGGFGGGGGGHSRGGRW
jgi:uncharacterized membrane protein YgcG